MKNAYEVRGDVTAIFISSKKYGNLETLISTSKLEKANEITGSWFAFWRDTTKSFYVRGSTQAIAGNSKNIQLHRLIMDCPADMHIDHINHDTLNNTDENLRIVTHAENQQNRRTYKNSNTGFRGVTWVEGNRKWRATIAVNKKRYHIGYFNSLAEADFAARKARAEKMKFSVEAV